MKTLKKAAGKKLLIALFAIALMAALAVFASAEGDVTTVASGYCGGEDDGTNLTWTLDSEGTLTISGEGKTQQFGVYNETTQLYETPWQSYSEMIDRIVFCEGVTEIEFWHFYISANQVILSKTITSYGYETFDCVGEYIVDPENPVYSNGNDGCLYNKDKSTFVAFASKEKAETFTLPESVLNLAWHSFQGATIEHLIIPENILHICDSAVWGQNYIGDVTILNPTCEIEEYNFVCVPTIYGFKNSTAQNYAKNSVTNYWGATFIPICPTHHANTQTYPEQSATCKAVGYTAGTYCFDCEEWIDGHTKLPIDPDAHDMQIGPYVPETCTTGGYAPWVCSRCGYEIQTDPVSALGHLWDDGEVITSATCSSTGTVRYTCKREGCGETKDAELKKDPNAHVLKTTVVPPTCLDSGYTSHACTLCRYGYADNEVPALGHAALDENGDCPRCHQHIKDVPQPETPAGSNDEQEAPKQNFFQRIIQWFKDFFAKLFGKKD